MLCYVQDVRTVRLIGQYLLDHHAVLSTVRSVDVWNKRREIVNVNRTIRSEKLGEQQYI